MKSATEEVRRLMENVCKPFVYQDTQKATEPPKVDPGASSDDLKALSALVDDAIDRMETMQCDLTDLLTMPYQPLIEAIYVLHKMQSLLSPPPEKPIGQQIGRMGDEACEKIVSIIAAWRKSHGENNAI